MTKELYYKTIEKPPEFDNKQATIDFMYEFVKFWLKNSNVTISNGHMAINSSQIILKKPDISDDNNFFLLSYAYNKIIGRD